MPRREHEDDSEGEYGLVMPFVVCPDPYEDQAFVAGCYQGQITEKLQSGVKEHAQYVPTPLVPQLDLLAMHHGLTFKSEPWEDCPDDWTWVEFGGAPSGQED